MRFAKGGLCVPIGHHNGFNMWYNNLGRTLSLGVQFLVGAGNFAVLALILFDLTGNEKFDHICERTVFLRRDLFDFAVSNWVKPHCELGFYYCHSIISLNYNDTIFTPFCMVS